MNAIIPDFIVHYSRGEPFRSITSLSRTEFDGISKTMNESNAWGVARFSDSRYWNQRQKVEREIRERFIEMGGRPVLRNPIYFFLGGHPRFEEHELNRGYAISLKDIDPETISFSYGDSMFCFNDENRRLAGEKYRNPLCEDLYLLENLPQLIAPGLDRVKG